MIRQLVYGMATFLPGVQGLRSKTLGGSVSARYCYGVWMRHMVKAQEQGVTTSPAVVAELGPGLSLGMGLAALISGSERYLAFDVVEYADLSRNLAIFDELVTLFKTQSEIPGEAEFPRVKPYLDDYTFPDKIYPKERLQQALSDARLNKIKAALAGDDPEGMIQYKAPWFSSENIQKNLVDMIFSQAVLEHVDDLPGTYQAMSQWLKPGGYVSHQIDFKSHGTAKQWNGHWCHPDWLWRLLRGKRPYLLNRAPCSRHVQLIKNNQIDIVLQQAVDMPSVITRQQLATQFQSLSDDDLTCSSVYILGQKK